MKFEGRIESIRTRLLNLSRSRGESFDFVLARYGVERFLHRLAQSGHAGHFILKGATLFQVWNPELHRPTRDLDLLGSGPDDPEKLRRTVLDVMRVVCAEDGLVFDEGSLSVEPIRSDMDYGGLRAKFRALLGKIRISVQVDVGFGDAVTPGPELLDLPSLLPDLSDIRLRSYPVATVIAEKFEALVRLDMQNSRMKDFFDLDFLLGGSPPDRSELEAAIKATFGRRETALPADQPAGLSDDFVAEKSVMWDAFLRKNGLEPRDFGEVVENVREKTAWLWTG
ncbi:nucleotidyl transferase AbiEii/AbiGii toxin family protein [Haloferula sp. A504]|uniref:nucleotidyl transferase AbiEii/AbiGii toxin family protein n=1 Tax=Haloferula sp. A504 TaxID=3373601 RepID=UPI0031BEEA8B|nr:nucleotidyl transferase AbiEii/AbiGii toxin family protein [Verrucomicrobiaceae bacterium E54]